MSIVVHNLHTRSKKSIGACRAVIVKLDLRVSSINYHAIVPLLDLLIFLFKNNPAITTNTSTSYYRTIKKLSKDDDPHFNRGLVWVSDMGSKRSLEHMLT